MCETEVNFAVAACLRCRKLHKRCDKKVTVSFTSFKHHRPSMQGCDRCQFRGLECVYPESNMKGKNPKPSIKNHGKTISQINTRLAPFGQHRQIVFNSSNQCHLQKQQVFDIFFQVFDGNVEDRKFFELAIAEANRDSTIHILFKVLQGVCEQQVGMKHLAEETIEQAKQSFSLCDQLSDFFLANASAFIAYYEAGCGRFSSARCFLQFVEYYFKQLGNQSLNRYQRGLRNFIVLAPEWIQQNDHLYVLKQWPTMVESVHEIATPLEWKLIFEDINSFNYLYVLKMISSVYDMLKISMARNIWDMVVPMIMHAMRISILSRVNKGKEIIESSALAITLLTENEQFILAPSFVVPHVVLATTIHLQIVKSIEKGERENIEPVQFPNETNMFEVELIDYYDLLGKDLRAINILASRFKKVELFHLDLMREIEEIMQRRSILLLLQQEIEKQSHTTGHLDVSNHSLDDFLFEEYTHLQ